MIKEYQFWGQYKLERFLPLWVYMDGVNIDGELFENNTPVTDGTVHIVVVPAAADFTIKQLQVSVPTYRQGSVIPIQHTFTWLPNAIDTQVWDLDYEGYPYGMGLNVLTVTLTALPPVIRSIWFNLLWKFSMEVG